MALSEAGTGGFTAEDERYMARALDLAATGRGRTSPDPMAGCVLARSGAVVGEGYSLRAGQPHAEVKALRAAGDATREATAYVTLEPCTRSDSDPSCVTALIAAGVRRVVVATLDPDRRVAGQGCAALREAGVSVAVGLLGAEARRLNRAYLTHRLTGRPLVTVQVSMTLDGRTASAAGEAAGVTGEAARRLSHALRDEADAICVGIGTIAGRDPRLTCRLEHVAPERGRRDPLRIVLDSLARTAATARILSPEVRQRPDMPGTIPARTIIVTTDLASRSKIEVLQRVGAEVWQLPAEDGLVPLPTLLDVLGRRGISHLLVEGGAQVNWSFLSRHLADEIRIYTSPKLVGGAQAPGPIGGPGVPLAQAWPVAHLQVSQVGDDLLLTGDLKPLPWTD